VPLQKEKLDQPLAGQLSPCEDDGCGVARERRHGRTGQRDQGRGCGAGAAEHGDADQADDGAAGQGGW
jgi:hypothetical protein